MPFDRWFRPGKPDGDLEKGFISMARFVAGKWDRRFVEMWEISFFL